VIHVSGLSSERFNRGLKLLELYESEARRCARASAYYAACAMLGAALEASLLLTCSLDADEVTAALPTMTKKPQKSSMDRWTLDELIAVSTHMGWLPTRRNPKGRKRIGDVVGFVQEMRNLLHAGRHLRRYPRRRLGGVAARDVSEIFSASLYWLEHKVISDLRRDMDKAEAEGKPR